MRKSPIETEYRITAKPSISRNPMSNTALEWIHQVIRNLVRTFNISQTYVDKTDMWTGILSASELVIISTTNRQKGYSPYQLIFVRDIILPIKHGVDWELILQLKHTQINKYNIRENRHRVDHDYKVENNVMLTNNASYKY